VALTPERKVKQQVVALLKEAGAYYFFPAANGLGRSGIPDIIACYKSRFIAIECKAGKGQTTALQERELKRIGEAGGAALVIREDNIALVTSTLNLLRALHDTETSICFRRAGDFSSDREDRRD
jgi:Holliday junction resolvase